MGNNKKPKKARKGKAKWKVGDEVYNKCGEQVSVVLFIDYDKEEKEFVYLLKCLEDKGSINFVSDCNVIAVKYEDKTTEDLKDFYEEETGRRVKIVK